MPNYQNGKIYKIISPSRPDMLPYFGATTQKLCQRIGKHRGIREKYNCKSSSLIECGDAVIILIENYPCNSKEELDRKEAEYILNNVCCNKVIPLRTDKQYREDNRERIAERVKQYYQDNKEEIVERVKQYYQDNKEEIVERQKEHYQENKERILELQSQKHLCLCGGRHTQGHKKKHERTKKHQTYLLTVSTEN